MIPGMNSAAAGMTSRLDQQDVITNNLANVNTPGYKRKVVGFVNFDQEFQRAAEAARNGTTFSPSFTIPSPTIMEDNSPGTIIQTGVPTDLALDGPGFFVVQDNGGEKLVRGGNFHLDGSGKLVTSEGLAVLGERSTIQITGKTWSVTDEGQIESDGTVIDKLRIVNSSKSPNPTRIVSGYLEQSNVNTVREMVSMITALRAYESCQKTIQSLDQTLDKLINQMAR